MNLRDLVAKALTAEGFDGLYSDWGCACKLDDLLPCGEPSPACEPGYLGPCEPDDCPNAGDCDFHIGPTKVGAGTTAPEGHNVELRGGPAVSSPERPA
jgi:hypothetical protein